MTCEIPSPLQPSAPVVQRSHECNGQCGCGTFPSMQKTMPEKGKKLEAVDQLTGQLIAVAKGFNS